jgi:predicted metal-binding membrane protein
VTAALHRSVFVPILGGLIAFTWFALWAWSVSPYGHYLRHGNWFELGPAAFLCRAVPGGGVVVPALIHTVGWVLMIVAMMLPTTLPLLEQFRRMSARRPDNSQLLALVVAGYLGVWTLFGLAAHGLDWLVLESVSRLPWLGFHTWVLGAAMIAGAGLFQFSALKHRCLERCRTPLSFIMTHWSGSAHMQQAFLLGAHHGAFCVGCCWALMLLMFVVGSGSIGWMLALGAIMAIEKNMPWGRRMSTPLGVFLIAAAGVTVLVNTTVIAG